MNISDLQYIQSVDASEVQGAGKYKDYNKKYKKFSYRKASADASADAKAFGDKTFAITDTFAIADSDAGVSLSGSKSSAHAATKYYDDKH